PGRCRRRGCDCVVSESDVRRGPGGLMRRLRPMFAGLLMLVAVAYLAYLVTSDIGTFRSVLAKADIRWFTAAVLLAMPMYLLKAIYHVSLLERGRTSWRPWPAGVHVSLQAQLVRYVPGKIWG